MEFKKTCHNLLKNKENQVKAPLPNFDKNAQKLRKVVTEKNLLQTYKNTKDYFNQREPRKLSKGKMCQTTNNFRTTISCSKDEIAKIKFLKNSQNASKNVSSSRIRSIRETSTREKMIIVKRKENKENSRQNYLEKYLNVIDKETKKTNKKKEKEGKRFFNDKIKFIQKSKLELKKNQILNESKKRFNTLDNNLSSDSLDTFKIKNKKIENEVNINLNMIKSQDNVHNINPFLDASGKNENEDLNKSNDSIYKVIKKLNFFDDTFMDTYNFYALFDERKRKEFNRKYESVSSYIEYKIKNKKSETELRTISTNPSTGKKIIKPVKEKINKIKKKINFF
jgi:hypothetical protein